jgi:hypothetical protein
VGRRVWSDPEVVALSQKFVTVADEVWRLQREDDPECRFFRKAVNGNEKLSRGSMQGTYVITAGGVLLARQNTASPKAIVKLLQSALVKWEQLPKTDKALKDADLVAPGFRWEQLFPIGGLHLRRTARDLPPNGDPLATPGERFNRETVWFSAAEARSILPDSSEPGSKQSLPDQVTQRLSCLVFVDNVRGQTIPYHPSEDADSELWSEVTEVEGSRVSLTLRGATAAKAAGPWLFTEPNDWIPRDSRRYPHSISTQVLGSAVYDLSSNEFVEFNLLALGQRKGRTINNGRGGTDQDVNDVGFVCELAPKGWRIAPTFIDVYGVEWAARP